MYEVSVPLFIHNFNILSHILLKAEKDAEKRKIDKSVFINARLAPDMLPLSKQIQIGTDMVRLGIGRLSVVKAPSFKDNEITFPDLQKRIQKTITFLIKLIYCISTPRNLVLWVCSTYSISCSIMFVVSIPLQLLAILSVALS